MQCIFKIGNGSRGIIHEWMMQKIGCNEKDGSKKKKGDFVFQFFFKKRYYSCIFTTKITNYRLQITNCIF